MLSLLKLIMMLHKKSKEYLKIPVFTEAAEMRLILEYHELGQIWILDNKRKKSYKLFLRFSN